MVKTPCVRNQVDDRRCSSTLQPNVERSDQEDAIAHLSRGSDLLTVKEAEAAANRILRYPCAVDAWR